jgi:hypothetical protein
MVFFLRVVFRYSMTVSKVSRTFFVFPNSSTFINSLAQYYMIHFDLTFIPFFLVNNNYKDINSKNIFVNILSQNVGIG